jgi:hypothetical protein
VYFDSRSGEELTVRKYLCKRCGQYIRADGAGHPACLKEVEQEHAMELEKERQQRCITKYGRVVSRAEEEWMDYPDYKVAGYGETYNQYLKRIAREKEEAYYKKIADRRSRKEQLPYLEHELKTLKWQIARDAEEEAAEKAVEEAGVEPTKQPGQADVLLKRMEEEQQIENQFSEYAKTREQKQ